MEPLPLSPKPSAAQPTRHTLGSILTWAIIRAAAVILVALLLYEYINYWIRYDLWWMITIAAVLAFVIYPAQIQYRIYKEETREIITNTLCASCRHFDAGAVMCLKHDEHVTESYLPCEGIDWEPFSAEERED